MTNMTKKALLATTLSVTALAGCSKAPTTPTPKQDAPVVKNANQVQPAGGEVVQPPCPQPGVPVIYNIDCRFIAFTACRRDYYGDKAGSLFLWDEALKDVYILNAALAGLDSDVEDLTDTTKVVDGTSSCSTLETLNPFAFADGKVLFSWGQYVYVYDMVAEERVAVAFDGQTSDFGGPRATVTADGHLLAYVSNRGTVVLKETDGAFYTKTRELTKIAAEANFQANLHDYGPGYPRAGVIYDLAISGDGRWIAVNKDGILFLYDVLNPHLFQLLPLDGYALGGQPSFIGHVAINFDGRFIAFTVNKRTVTDQQFHGDYLVGNDDSRLLVLDRQTGYIDTVPYANLGDTISGGNDYHKPIILDPFFCPDGRTLFFEILVGDTFKVWRYDILNETLRAMVILNNVLGEDVDDVLISQPDLDP